MEHRERKLETKLGTGDFVEITSREAAEREGIEVGLRGKVVCMSWKFPGGFVVEFNELQHHFNVTELRQVPKPKRKRQIPQDPDEFEVITFRCEICNAMVEIDADDAKGHYSKRCRTCKHGGGLLFDRKRMRQNLSNLGMRGRQKLSQPGDSPELVQALDAPPPVVTTDEETRQRAFADYRRILQARGTEARRLLLEALSSLELPFTAIAVFIAHRLDGKSLREIEAEQGVSKTEAARLVKAVEAALPSALTLELGQGIEEITREEDGPRWEDTGWDFSDMHQVRSQVDDGSDYFHDGPAHDDHGADSKP